MRAAVARSGVALIAERCRDVFDSFVQLDS
jgi:hypothetical protein